MLLTSLIACSAICMQSCGLQVPAAVGPRPCTALLEAAHKAGMESHPPSATYHELPTYCVLQPPRPHVLSQAAQCQCCAPCLRSPAATDPQLLWPRAPDSPAEAERYRGELAALHLAALELRGLRDAAAAVAAAAAERAAAMRQGLGELSALVDAAGVRAMQLHA